MMLTNPIGIRKGEMFFINPGGGLARFHILLAIRPAVDNGQIVHHTRPSKRNARTRKTHQVPQAK
jgi:hypothetical protein